MYDDSMSIRKTLPSLNHSFQWAALSLASGILAGLAGTIFLYSLNWITTIRVAHPVLVFGLPVGGLLIGLLYWAVGHQISTGQNLVLDEIHNPRQVLPRRMTPVIFIASLITHLLGASTGREGAIVQMGSSLSDQLSRFFNVENAERKILLVCGMGAGFGAALGAPIAGVFFGMEVVRIGRLRPFALFECGIASFSAYWITLILHAPHTHFSPFFGSLFDPFSWGAVLLACLVFAFLARLFISTTHTIETFHQKWIRRSYFRPALGGLILLLFFLCPPLQKFEGLSIPALQDFFHHPAFFSDSLWKLILTAIAIGSGFKGGEFTPLVFIGAAAGSALSIFHPESLPVLTAVGFCSVFAAASNTPFSCAIMACELFGWRIAPYALTGCFLSYYLSGNLSLYRSQLVSEPKTELLWDQLSSFFKS